MALVRILVDGYSLLHGWPELAPGAPRHSTAARDELVHMMRLYSDAVQTPVTIVFDGGGHRGERTREKSNDAVEILYSRSGQTADQIIERVTHRMQPYGEVLVVTDDYAERDTVMAVGGFASSCDAFIETVQRALADLQREVKSYNSAEKRRYNRS
jgi:predicted RNA-binding protein with PIN domain